MPLLSTIIWLPIAAAVVLAFFPRDAARAIKGVGFLASLATFVISLGILPKFSDVPGFQLVENHPWIPQWGINYALGVDGISLWLVLLSTLLTPVVFLASWYSIHKHPKEYVISFLIMEAAMIGFFVATDLVLLYVFFELTLIPMYLIIGVWGGANRVYAAIKFFLFTIAGSLLMLLGIIYLGFVFAHQSPIGLITFSITDLYGVSLMPRAATLLFFAFTLAFAIKVPLFPLHTWLPDAHVEAPTGGSIILAGVMLKMGTYGFVRLVLPLFPDMTRKYTPLLLTLSVIGIIYGALVSWVQPDMKKLVAYSSVSHLGFCVLGIFALNQTAIEGSILQMVNHGISTGALFLLVGVIYERRHTRLLADYGGLADSMPVYTTIFVITVLSSVGLPGLNGFVGEFLILSGTFKTAPVYAIIAATGVILAAIYLLWLVQKVFYGPITNEENKTVREIGWNEIAAMAPLLVMMVWIGVHPNTFLKKMTPSVTELLSVVNQENRNRVIVTEQSPSAPPVATSAQLSPSPRVSGVRVRGLTLTADLTTPHPAFGHPLPADAGRGATARSLETSRASQTSRPQQPGGAR